MLARSLMHRLSSGSVPLSPSMAMQQQHRHHHHRMLTAAAAAAATLVLLMAAATLQQSVLVPDTELLLDGLPADGIDGVAGNSLVDGGMSELLGVEGDGDVGAGQGGSGGSSVVATHVALEDPPSRWHWRFKELWQHRHGQLADQEARVHKWREQQRSIVHAETAAEQAGEGVAAAATTTAAASTAASTGAGSSGSGAVGAAGVASATGGSSADSSSGGSRDADSRPDPTLASAASGTEKQVSGQLVASAGSTTAVVGSQGGLAGASQQQQQQQLAQQEAEGEEEEEQGPGQLQQAATEDALQQQELLQEEGGLPQATVGGQEGEDGALLMAASADGDTEPDALS